MLYSEQALHRRGLSDLVAVFDWLRRNHVEKIVKVMVIDDGDPSHADASIEEALRDFNVEIWDWKRLDLSTEVIWKSTNVVKEISLYSTGNNAVLMGWASPQGLPNKKNFPMVGSPVWPPDSEDNVLTALLVAQKSEPVHPRGMMRHTVPTPRNWFKIYVWLIRPAGSRGS